MKFSFNLEPLLDYRKRLEELSKKDFAEAAAQLREEEERLVGLRRTYREASEEVDELKTSGRTHELGLYAAYLARLKTTIAGQEKAIEEARGELERRRGELLEATKEKKVVEVMRERSFEAFRKRERRRDQKETDELATTRFKRSGT